MTESYRRTDPVWKDAEALVERIERAARSDGSPDAFYSCLIDGLRRITGAAAIALEIVDGRSRETLARCGIAIHDVGAPPSQTSTVDGALGAWLGDASHPGNRFVASRRVHVDARLCIDLRFNDGVKLDLHQPLAELVQVLLDLAAPVYLGSQLDLLRSRLDAQHDRDRLLTRLYQGATLTESFASIASAVAAETSADRVSLLRFQSNRWELIATSTQPRIDRRARQVRSLERLTQQWLAHSPHGRFVLGEASESASADNLALEAYLNDSGSREIHAESIRDSESNDVIAGIVLERFRASSQHVAADRSGLDRLREPLRGAVSNAIRRDEGAWSALAGRLQSGSQGRKMAFALAGLSILAVAGFLIPAPLKIPAEGRIVATEKRHIFAPAEGIVSEVLVRNSEAVRAGQPLLVVHSPSLDLKQRTIEGDMATAQTRLNSLSALRSQQRESTFSADEQVLRTEIEGLQAQLKLVQAQRSELMIRSPIDGRVDAWDLQQSMTARPISHGQFLFDIVSTDKGWTVELEVPDQQIGYILEAQRTGTCSTTLRLRSSPTTTYQADVKQVADVAHLNPSGQSVVRVTLPLESDASSELRSGATVMAQVDCGHRAIGFVWLRGIVEWWRVQSLF